MKNQNDKDDQYYIRVFRNRKLNLKYDDLDPRHPENRKDAAPIEPHDENDPWRVHYPSNFQHFPAFMQMLADHFSGKNELPEMVMSALHDIFYNTMLTYFSDSPEDAFKYLKDELGITKNSLKVNKLTVFEDVTAEFKNRSSLASAKRIIASKYNVSFNTIDTRFKDMREIAIKFCSMNDDDAQEQNIPLNEFNLIRSHYEQLLESLENPKGK